MATNPSDEEDLLDSDKSNSCLQTSNADKEDKNGQSTLGPDDEALLLSSPSQSPKPKHHSDVTDGNHVNNKTNKTTLPVPETNNQPESAHIISDDDGDDDDVVILDDDVNFNRAKFPHIVLDDDEEDDDDDDEEEDEDEDEEDEEFSSSEESFSDESDMNNDDLSDYLDGKIKIFYTHGSFFLWNGEDVQMLREECRIVGKLTGCLPRAPRQNNQLGLPLQLMPEEAKLLVDIDAAVVVEEDPASEEVLTLRKKAFREVREENFKIQQKLYEECRKEEVRHRFRDIIAGKRAKKRKLMLDGKTVNVSSEEPSAASVSCIEQIKKPTDKSVGTEGQAMDEADKLTDKENKKVDSLSKDKPQDLEDDPMDEAEKLTVEEKHNENSLLKDTSEDKEDEPMNDADKLTDKEKMKVDSLSKDKSEVIEDDSDSIGETDMLTVKEKRKVNSLLKDKSEIIEDDPMDGADKLTDKEKKKVDSFSKDKSEVIEDDSDSIGETDKLTVKEKHKDKSEIIEDDPMDGADKLNVKEDVASLSKDNCEVIEDDSTDETEKLTVQDIVKSETSANHALVQIFTENPWKQNVHLYDDWEYPNTQKELIRYLVFKDLWRKGFFMTSGSKFGGDFLVYPGDPSRYHSHYIAICKNQYDEIPSLEIVTLGRLASNVRKTALLCSIDRNRKVLYTSIKWTGIT